MATTATIGADELNYYRQQRSAASRAYLQGTNQLTFQRGQAAADYGYGLGDLEKRFKNIYEQMPGGFARRGVLTSGIAKEGYEKYGTEYADALGRFNQQNQQQGLGFDLQQKQLDQSNTAAQEDLAAQEAARKQAVSDSVRPFISGY